MIHQKRDSMMRGSDEYNVRFQRFAQKWESLIIMLVMIFSCLLIAGEIIYQFEPVRQLFIETERLEGSSQTP